MNIEWMDIEGFDGRYRVSANGQVLNVPKRIFLKQGVNHKGYLTVRLNSNTGRYGIANGKPKTFQVARLVASAFVKNTENKPQVNHIDGNKKNNWAHNLEWCTAKENSGHAERTGLKVHVKGEENGQSKLIEKQVRVIKHALSIGSKGIQKILAKMMNVTPTAIYEIKVGANWSHIKV